MSSAQSAIGDPRAGATAGSGLPWGLGFLAFIPLPVVSQLTAGIVMAIVGGRRMRRGGLVGEQGRQAANWGLTYIAITLLCTVLFAALGAVANTTPEFDDTAGIMTVTVLLVWVIVVNIVHVVCCIIGLVKASKGRVFRCPLAMPFLGRGGDDATVVL